MFSSLTPHRVKNGECFLKWRTSTRHTGIDVYAGERNGTEARGWKNEKS